MAANDGANDVANQPANDQCVIIDGQRLDRVW